ncbi:hypothetical protein ILUMI_19623, partial [Ignelater luminosus]
GRTADDRFITLRMLRNRTSTSVEARNKHREVCGVDNVNESGSEKGYASENETAAKVACVQLLSENPKESYKNYYNIFIE